MPPPPPPTHTHFLAPSCATANVVFVWLLLFVCLGLFCFVFCFLRLYVCTTICGAIWLQRAHVHLKSVGAGRSSEVERSLMVRWVVGSILHGVDPLSYFSFQPVIHDWCNKGRGMCYPVCGMVHIKEPLLSIEKSSPSGGSGFPLSLSEWSFTICLTPYNRR